MFYAISIIGGAYMLINALLGFAGKVIPFSGIQQYTKESISKVARMMCIPYLIAAISFFVALFMDMFGHASYPAYFISIGLLIVILFIHIHLNNKHLQKN